MLVEDINDHTEPSWVNYTVLLIGIAITCWTAFLDLNERHEVFKYFAFYVDEQSGSFGGLTKLFFNSFSSIFFHADWRHFAGNACFLLIFGDNIEYVMGRKKYIAFFLLCGVISGWMQFILSPFFEIPALGMSGALAGVMGAYARIFPWKKLKFFYVNALTLMSGETTYSIQAFWYLLLWLIGNILYACITYGSDGGGVAFITHVSGFLLGFAIANKFRDPEVAIIDGEMGHMTYQQHLDFMNQETEYDRLKAEQFNYLKPAAIEQPPSTVADKIPEEKITIKEDIVMF